MSNKHHERHEATAAKAVDPDKAVPGPQEGSEADPPLEEDRLHERIVSLETQVATLTEESATLKDQYLRSLAEYENFRKRMFREREDLQKYANFPLLGDLVSLLDDFDRAIGSAEHAQDYPTLHDGIVLIRRQFGSILEGKYGLVRFESLGKPFDPHVHEAVASEVGEVEEPEVSLEFLPGYRLHDRVVRSAKVRVRMPSPSPKVQAKAEAADLFAASAEKEAVVSESEEQAGAP